jgi:hypothetical protein
MFVSNERNSLVDDLDIVVVEASPLAVEGGGGDVASDVTVTITVPMPPTYPITITLPFSITLPMPPTYPITITVAEELAAD